MEESVNKGVSGYEPSEQEKVMLLRMELQDLSFAFIISAMDEFGEGGLKFCKAFFKNRISNLLMWYRHFFKVVNDDAISIASVILSRRALLGEKYHIVELNEKNCEADIKDCPIIKIRGSTEICEIISEGEDAAAKMINPKAIATCRKLTVKKRPQCRLSVKIGE